MKVVKKGISLVAVFVIIQVVLNLSVFADVGIWGPCIDFCRSDPARIGLEYPNGSTQGGMAQCKNDPVSCGITCSYASAKNSTLYIPEVKYFDGSSEKTFYGVFMRLISSNPIQFEVVSISEVPVETSTETSEEETSKIPVETPTDTSSGCKGE